MPMHKIEVDDVIYRYLKSKAEPFVDTPNTVLHRELLENNSSLSVGHVQNIPQLPVSIPAALQQIIEVVDKVKTGDYCDRTKATKIVASCHGVTRETIQDKYTRQLGLTASDFDVLLDDSNESKLIELLNIKFPGHKILVDHAGNYSSWRVDHVQNIPQLNIPQLPVSTPAALRHIIEVVYLENAEIVLINPLIPQSWGTSKTGGHPQTPGRKYPAPLFHRSHLVKAGDYDRTGATRIVARRHDVTREAIQDKYTRQLGGLTASDFDVLLDELNESELIELLKIKFPNHRTLIDQLREYKKNKVETPNFHPEMFVRRRCMRYEQALATACQWLNIDPSTITEDTEEQQLISMLHRLTDREGNEASMVKTKLEARVVMLKAKRNLSRRKAGL